MRRVLLKFDECKWVHDEGEAYSSVVELKECIIFYVKKDEFMTLKGEGGSALVGRVL